MSKEELKEYQSCRLSLSLYLDESLVVWSIEFSCSSTVVSSQGKASFVYYLLAGSSFVLVTNTLVEDS